MIAFLSEEEPHTSVPASSSSQPAPAMQSRSRSLLLGPRCLAELVVQVQCGGRGQWDINGSSSPTAPPAPSLSSLLRCEYAEPSWRALCFR